MNIPMSTQTIENVMGGPMLLKLSIYTSTGRYPLLDTLIPKKSILVSDNLQLGIFNVHCKYFLVSAMMLKYSIMMLYGNMAKTMPLMLFWWSCLEM